MKLFEMKNYRAITRLAVKTFSAALLIAILPVVHVGRLFGPHDLAVFHGSILPS